MEEINKDNCHLLLSAFIKNNNLNSRSIANTIGCQEASIIRILAGVTVAAAIPIASGAVVYSIVKGVKYFIGKHQLDTKDIDLIWKVID